jgi:lipooligosaccharide transport system permease protein
MFASIAMCFTAIAPNIDFFNYPAFLFITPMIFLAGTFFPLTSLPSAAQIGAMVFLPLTHIVNVTRGVIGGNVELVFGLDPALIVALSVVWLVAVTVFFFVLAINLMKKRLTT